jgi:lincosamide nucleotidyltransferase A/C/D/E
MRMNATTVLHILDLFATGGVQVWLDGGWGVDALLGRISRPHYDLDLVLPLGDLARAVEMLVGDGFVVTEEELGRAVLEHAEHGRVDLHPTRFDAQGNGMQVQLPVPPAAPLVYPSDGFVTGLILGRTVPCISADVQISVRLGYDRSEKHRQDAIALCAAFGLQVPEYLRL